MHAFSNSPAVLSDPPRCLAEQDYERLDHLLGTHFAKLSVEVLKLAAFAWAMVLVLVVLAVSALRMP
jgi:hypothetical protein